ncbi:MAG: Ni,Fe-hydrogenase III large subunit [Gammaproteobacteria bacterium]|nr:Ni,Fe-hydrogenase III large subunit [Gammaproteobacteria bacterium]
MWASACEARDSTAAIEVEDVYGAAHSPRSAQDAHSLPIDVYAAFLIDSRVLILELPVQRKEMRSPEPADYPGIEALFPCASRMQRALFDISGMRASDPDRRPWLRHPAEGYDFIRVSGEGVHEIAVGPVHAGTIEPGHFRFSAVGEKVLRLEERLGYTHKAIERRFTELPLLEGARLAARIAGDSAVAYSWAYCQALEGMSGCEIPPRAAALRALFLELERIANHLGDVGALANDAGFAFGLTQFSRIKEELLRAISEAFGQRYLLDAVVPGGTQLDVSAERSKSLATRIAAIKDEATELRAIYEDHAGVRDRFTGAGILTPELASRLGVLGLVGRASGQALDARVDSPCTPYGELLPAKIVRQEGDVAARVAVRFEELAESCRLAQDLLTSLPSGAHRAAVQAPLYDSFATGLIEGWRGPVFLALEAGPGGTILRCHPHDPSWQNWPALEHAILGNIVADFPLINKSFNLAYSGVDL